MNCMRGSLNAKIDTSQGVANGGRGGSLNGANGNRPMSISLA